MSSIPAAEVIPFLGELFMQSCLDASIIAFLLYDYILTLGREFDLFWFQRGALVSRTCFAILRVSILGTAIMTVLGDYVPKYYINLKACAIVYDANAAFQILAFMATAGVTAVRAYAVTGGQWVWTITTSTLAFVSFACGACLLLMPSYQEVLLGSLRMCLASPDLSPTQNKILIMVLMICGTLADAVLIAATWVRTFHVVRSRASRRLRRRSISWLILRDGTLYFLAVFVVNLCICIIGLRFDSLNWLVDLATPLQLVLLSRLLINLREASDRDLYMGSEDTPNDIDELPDTSIKQSTIRFNHTETHSGAEEAFAPVDEQPRTIEEDDDANVHEELQDDLEWRAADFVRAQATPAADGGPSPICA